MSRSVSSRAERGVTARRLANDAMCTRRVHNRDDVHKIAQPTLREQVSAELCEFPNKTIERLTNAPPDTVRAWRCERRFPSWPYLKKLEPHLESVQRYIAHEFPHSMAAAHPDSPEALALAFQQFIVARRHGGGEA